MAVAHDVPAIVISVYKGCSEGNNNLIASFQVLMRMTEPEVHEPDGFVLVAS